MLSNIAHRHCTRCDDCIREAEILARVTGSRAAAHYEGEHYAEVTR